MRRALLALLLAAACTSGGTGASPSATPSPTPQDPFSAIAPPKSPGIGDADAILSNRAYAASQGLLAEALFERDTVLGTNPKGVATDLAGASQDPTVLRDVGSATEAGLAYRPLFGKGVSLASSGFVQVVRSQWTGEQVSGLNGESALKISWSGAVRYTVTYQGTERPVAYALETSWIFSPDTRIAGALDLVTVLKGTSHIVPQPAACTRRGVIVPVGPAPTDTDFTAGPYPAPPVASPPACPLTT